MLKKQKKGFTIVELVIVIAVIAILAAVLIPTFTTLIRKANVTNDTALVRNLNTALASDVKEHNTMQEALDAAESFGFDVAKLSAKASGNEILWDSANDCFVYLNDNKPQYIPNFQKTTEDVKNHDYFRIITELPALSEGILDLTNQPYSIYLNNNNFSGNVKTDKGFDSGKNEKLQSVAYEGGASAKEVVIRTNGGTLNVNAENDVVNHYDKATKVVIGAIDGNSYHEYGSVKQIIVKQGHVVTEASSIVLSIAAQPDEGKTVSIDVSKKVTEVVVTAEYADNTTVTGTTPVTESATVINALDEAKKYAPDASTVPASFIIDRENKTITIKDAIALYYFGYVLDTSAALKKENGNHTSIWYGASYANVKVYLDADIDLENAVLDSGMSIYAKLFDGQNHVIKNAKILNINGDNTGLFKEFGAATVKNFVLDNITVETNCNQNSTTVNINAGVLVGNSTGVIENITVKNSSVTGGKYTGAVLGYGYCNVSNCTIENTTVKGQYKMGGIIGYICADEGKTANVTNNNLTDVSVEGFNICTGKSQFVIGKIVGNYNCNGNCTGNTFTGTTTAANNIGKIEGAFVVEQ